MGRNGEVIIIRLSITPSANRNTYSVATLIIHIPRVEALHASTLGYEIATPTELPGVRTIHNGLLVSLSWAYPLHASTLGYTLTTFPINATHAIAPMGLAPALPMELRHLRIVFRHALIVLGGS